MYLFLPYIIDDPHSSHVGLSVTHLNPERVPQKGQEEQVFKTLLYWVLTAIRWQVQSIIHLIPVGKVDVLTLAQSNFPHLTDLQTHYCQPTHHLIDPIQSQQTFTKSRSYL